MEKTNKLVLLVASSLAIVILGLDTLVTQPQFEAWAFTTVNFTFTFNNSNNQCFYGVKADRFYCVSNAGSGGAAFQRINAQSGVVDTSFFLKPLFGNTSNPQIQPNLALGGLVNSIWCDDFNQCYFAQQVGGTNPHDQIAKWQMSGIAVSYINYTVGTIEKSGIDGVSGVSQAALGNIWAVVDSGINRNLKTIGSGCAGCNNGNAIPLQETLTFLLSPTNVNIGQITHCISCGGDQSAQRIAVSYQNSGGGFVIDVINRNTNAGVCTSSLTNMATTNGAALFYSGTNDKWVISDNSGDATFVNRDACTASQTVTSASITQNSNAPIKSFGVNPVKSEYYAMYTVGGASQSSISIMNLNSPASLIVTLSSTSNNPPRFQAMAIGTSNHQVLVSDSSQTGIVFFIDGFSGGGGGGGGGSAGCSVGGAVFINSQGQCCTNIFDTNGQIILTTYCSTPTSNGLPTGGSGGALSTFRSGSNVTTTTFNLGCGLGIVNCNNTDSTSNGVGLWLLLILLILSYALLVGIHYKVSDAVAMRSGGTIQLTQVLNINPLLIVVMLVVDLGIAMQLNWTNNIVFYTIVALIVGFLAFGIYKRITGGNQ